MICHFKKDMKFLYNLLKENSKLICTIFILPEDVKFPFQNYSKSVNQSSLFSFKIGFSLNTGLNMDFAFKYGMFIIKNMNKSLKSRIWLQYILDIPVF